MTTILIAIFAWTTPSGAIAFTDDSARIPQAHAEEAETIEPKPWHCYRNLTPIGEIGPCTRDEKAPYELPE